MSPVGHAALTESNIPRAAVESSGTPDDVSDMSPENARAEVLRLRDEVEYYARVLAATADSYVDGLRSSTVEDALNSLSNTFRVYMTGTGLASDDVTPFCRIGENSLGFQAGDGVGEADNALVQACFAAIGASGELSTVEGNGRQYVASPICHPNQGRDAIGFVAAELNGPSELTAETASVMSALPLATAYHLERLAQIGIAGRAAQFARAAARTQLRLTEPHDRTEALRIAIDELSACDDLVGAAAVELGGDAPRVAARYGSIHDEHALALLTGGDESELMELPVLINGEREALLVVDSASGTQSEDEMLGSIAAAIAGTVVRHRAAATIESLRRSATRRLVEAQERERSMVAADIHDGVLQQLGATAIRLELAQLRVEQSDFDTARAIIEDGAKEIRSCARELRALLMELRPQVLDDNGLNAALKELGRHVDDVVVEVTSNVPDDLGNEYSITVFRIVQEALTNIQKHSRASAATVDVGIEAERLVIEVKDNGVGYEGAVSGPSAEGSHLGLLGMRERARMLGGEFSIAGASGGGTVVRTLLPLPGAGRHNNESSNSRERA